MKNMNISMKIMMIILTSSILLISCYSHKSIVGNGAQKNIEVTKWNHYLIEGLAPVAVSDVTVMADGAEDYSVHTRQTFVNGLVSFVTFGVYTPTTTTVTK